MRTHNVARTQVATTRLPRGWVFLSLALLSWMLAIAAGSALLQLFTFVLAAV